jgi:hypothetical protein
MEDGGFGYYGMGFEAFGEEEEHGADQIWDGSLEGYELAHAASDAEENQTKDQVDDGSLNLCGMELGATVTDKDQWADAHPSAWEWGENPMELEISKEVVHTPTKLTLSPIISPSTPTAEDSSLSTDDSPVVRNNEGPSSNDAPSSSASNKKNSADEWLCDFTNCGRSFTHRHKLKYVYQFPRTPCSKLI